MVRDKNLLDKLNRLNAEKLKEKTPEADKKAVDDKVPETLQRLDVNQAAEKEEFESGPPGSAEDVCICWRTYMTSRRTMLFCIRAMIVSERKERRCWSGSAALMVIIGLRTLQAAVERENSEH
ncbi:hypothetical protein PI126_g16766 [Phytophthora idaei]|nr:hypothetical protein PI126_g16766 [Phytophthora idaei]